MQSDEHEDALAKAIAAANAEYERKHGYYTLDDPQRPPDPNPATRTYPTVPPGLTVADLNRRIRPPAPCLRPMVCYTAWNKIQTAAVRSGYIRVSQDSIRPKGCSQYIIDTIMHPLQTWTDTRPPDLRDQDAIRAAAYFPPIWVILDKDCWSGRRQRTVLLLNLDTTILAHIAADFDLSDDYHREATIAKTPTAQLSTLLEAWGHDYLVPEHQPNTPAKRATKLRRPSRGEIVW